jgi:hypothetical protein
MNQFTVNSLISRETSTITGSLTVLGTIDTIIGTASLAQTSSQTQQTATASFSTVTLVQTSSYAQTSVSSSYALTASFVEDKGIGINTIGWLSPNVFMGDYNFTAAKNSAAGILSGGTFFSPVEIKKTCTCATMSVAFVGPLAASSCYIALYTNSPNNLPEYRIFHGETAKSISTTIYQNYLVTQSAVTLEKGNIYWVALSLSGSNNAVATLAGANTLGNIYNEFLGNRLAIATISNNNPLQLIYIRSGSTNLSGSTYTFPETSSQVISNYHTGINDAQARNMLRMPFLKVNY